MKLYSHESFIQRCIQLAKKGGKDVGSNPNVGAILVHEGKIIGEGYHCYYGEEHAEINAFNNVLAGDKDKIPNATLYVSLEPCSHHGKTPPCAQRIVQERVKKVVIGCEDPNPQVSGRGILYLRENGIEVITNVLEKECKQLILPFIANLQNRPYILLKWAQSADHYISKKDTQTWLTNKYSKVLAHKLRAESDGIMIGKNTALIDKPLLNVRYFTGQNPIIIVLDSHLQASEYYGNIQTKTLVLNKIKSAIQNNVEYIQLQNMQDMDEILKELFSRGIFRILVEGGSEILQFFINSDKWDQAIVFKTKTKLLSGISAPILYGHAENKTISGDDLVHSIFRDKYS